MALHLVEIPLRLRRFTGWALKRGFLAVPPGDRSGRPREPDLGYALHAALAGLFGNAAPRPFLLAPPRLPGSRRPAPMAVRAGLDQVPLLGYSSLGGAELQALASLAAGDLSALMNIGALQSRPLPDPWPDGLRIGFDLRACPVRRRKRTLPFETNTQHPVRKSVTYSRGVEVDAFQLAAVRAAQAGQAAPDRASVYLQWLCERFSGAPNRDAALTLSEGSVRVRSYRSVRLLRRPKRGGRRSAAWLTRPEVWFAGEATIADPSSFPGVLASGVGRHSGFGFGMLLLRAP